MGHVVVPEPHGIGHVSLAPFIADGHDAREKPGYEGRG